MITGDDWYDAHDVIIPNNIITSTYQGQVISNRAHQALTVNSSDPIAGSVSGGGVYFPGTNVTLTATANSGYEFVNWTVNGVEISSTTPFVYSMPNTNTTVIGNFAISDGYLVQDWSIDDLEREFIDSLRITNDSQYITGLTEKTGRFGTNIRCFTSGNNVVLYSLGTIYAPLDSYHLFGGMLHCGHIYLDNFNTSNVENMSWMFSSDISLQTVDTGFDTSNVRNMSGMFHKCTSLSSLDLSGFNTGNVENMSWMF